MDSNARRLTRSTYIGEPIPTNGSKNGRNRRSSSTDSENGWIPPPPLLPLGTRFLIANPSVPSRRSSPAAPSPASDPIATQIAIAHLKCQPSSSSNNNDPLNPSESTALIPCFKVLPDHELIIPQSRPNTTSIEQDTSGDEFISRETKHFNQRHRQSEMIEKRSKKLEKEKLIHERFKLKNRLELLMNGSGPDWKSIRTLTLRRIKEDELRERSAAGHLQPQSNQSTRETEFEKVERMRRIMIQETEETLKRYDKLLDTRKVSKPGLSLQSSQLKPPTPSKSQPKPRTSPKASKRKLTTNQTCSDQDHSQKTVKLTTSKSKKTATQTIKHELQSSQHDSQSQLPQSTPPLLSPLTLPQSPHPQSVQRPVEIHQPTPPLRDSLYDLPSTRRSAMDDHYVNRPKRMGRTLYALGCNFPDMSKMQIHYMDELQEMRFERRVGPLSTPFDRPARVVPVKKKEATTSKTTAKVTEPNNEEGDDDWVEFNPTINDEREIVAHHSGFVQASQFFDLGDELEYLEEKNMLAFQKQHLPQNKEDWKSLSQAELLHIIHGGKSIRKLIEERIASWDKESSKPLS
ncbi:hypothetical protein PCANC_10229 [Puccinia coronata f. sp. avenae]|uniref:Something about silencing protein 4 domain-containing protein n=1 Tax=Puccinia coronata f. sp. avenae TaxID=200324 RepID=A0A2N5VEL3_9BASI|nr:hypothetical protein PCANC_10229 [Puccinia coronata f. sp. avenae]